MAPGEGEGAHGEHDKRLAAVTRAEARLTGLLRERERMAQEHRRVLAKEPALAVTVLRQLAAVDADVDAQEGKLADAQARAAEWHDAPAQDTARRYLEGLVGSSPARCARPTGPLRSTPYSGRASRASGSWRTSMRSSPTYGCAAAKTSRA